MGMHACMSDLCLALAGSAWLAGWLREQANHGHAHDLVEIGTRRTCRKMQKDAARCKRGASSMSRSTRHDARGVNVKQASATAEPDLGQLPGNMSRKVWRREVRGCGVPLIAG